MEISPADRQIILFSAGTDARRETLREQVVTLATTVDWQSLTDQLRARKLLTVLGPRLLELAEDSAGDEFAASVVQALESGRRQSTLLDLIYRRVAAALADAGIRSTPLKGPTLSEEIYGDPGRRLSSDIDILVPPNQMGAAVEVVRGLGYAGPNDYTDRDGLPQLHFALVHEREEWPPIELHWRIHWYERSFASEQLLPPATSDAEGWRPDRAADLAALLLFYARDGFIDLRLAADLGAWWDAHGAILPPAALAELSREYPALARPIQVAAIVADDVVGLPSTPLFAGLPGLGIRGRMAGRLANPNPHGSQAQLYADRGFIDGLLSPRGGFGAFVKRQILPPPEVLAEHARIAQRVHVRSSFGRGIGILARYGLTMARLASGPETPHPPQRRPSGDRTGSRQGASGPCIGVMGVPVAAMTESEVSEKVVSAARAREGNWTITANLDHLRRYRSESTAKELIDEADLIVADGTPLIWASRLAGEALPERVAGSNIIWSLCDAASREGVTVFLLGGDAGVADRASEILRERYEHLDVAGTLCPPFGFEDDPDELDRIERRVTEAAPGIVLVGLGFPKQDLLIRRLRRTEPRSSFVGVGISLSFVAGEVSRAPEWMQRLSVEWLHRLTQEPRRLLRRYLVDGIPFALALFASAARHRLGARGDDTGWGRIGDQQR